MNRSSGNQGDGTFDAMRGPSKDNVNDSHRTLTHLIGAAREALDDRMSSQEAEQAGLVRFEQAVARKTLQSGARMRAWTFGFGLIAAGAAAAFVMFHRVDSTLTFAVLNGSVSDGGYVRAKASGGTELQFSDGSSLALDPGTSTRVTDIDAHGSRVLLESGRAHVRVTHKPAAKWVIDAGPYSVHVVGTEFDVRWSGAEEVLDVQMQRGTVIVRGPLARGGLTMEAGQHLVANAKDGEIFLDATPGSEASNLPRAPRRVAGAEIRRGFCRRPDVARGAAVVDARRGSGARSPRPPERGPGCAQAPAADDELEQADRAGRFQGGPRGRRAARADPHVRDGARLRFDRAGGRRALRAPQRRREAGPPRRAGPVLAVGGRARGGVLPGRPRRGRIGRVGHEDARSTGTSAICPRARAVPTPRRRWAAR